MAKTPAQKFHMNKAEERLKTTTQKIIMIGSVFCLFIAAVAGFIGWRAGLFTSMESLRNFLLRMGPWAPVAFLLIQTLQVIIPVIPGGITCAAGVIAFGPIYGLLYDYLGLLIGSTLVFFAARKLGLPFIKGIVSEKSFDTYIGWLDKSQPLFNKLFAVAVFLPFFPDDILCMLAGVSKIKTSTFLLINITLKLPFLLPYSFGMPKLMQWMGLS